MELKQLHANDNKPYTAFAESRQGGRKENQDSFMAMETSQGFLVVVCDGMGGGPGGLTASTIAVKQIAEAMGEKKTKESASEAVIRAITQANKTIIADVEENPELKGMGSTVALLLVTPHSAIVAHVGDSRVYQLRGRTKLFRTFDHSVVFDLVRQKALTEEQARLAPNSNIITRALGIAPKVEADVAELPYERGDRFVLCTDGIHGTMPEPELIRMLASRSKPLGPLVDNIATQIDYAGRKLGGSHDNLTLAMVEVKTNSTLKQVMPRKSKIIITLLSVLLTVSLTLNLVQACNGGHQSVKGTGTSNFVDTTQTVTNREN